MGKKGYDAVRRAMPSFASGDYVLFMRCGEHKRHFLVFIMAGLTATLLQLALHIRPGPLGMPFSQTSAGSFVYKVAWEWLTLAALSAPFFVLGALLSPRQSPSLTRSARLLHMLAAFVALAAGHAEHELQRFMGTRLTLDYLATYGRVGQSPGAIGYALADDAGGAYSSLLLAILPVLFLIAASLALWRKEHPPCRRASPAPTTGRHTGLFFAALIAAPPAGPVPQARPPDPSSPPRTCVGVVWDALLELLDATGGSPPSSEDFEAARDVWTRRGPDSGWVFPDARHPLWRIPSRPCRAPSRPLNFVIIQLETFRAMDMLSFNPGLDVQPTPFLDSLAQNPKSASWVRFYANGLPTVSAFMAIHTSLIPHSRKRVATAFRDVELDAFPVLLRKEGYRALFITGADPDWDRQGDWAKVWYDRIIFDSRYDGRDDILLEDAANLLLDPSFNRAPFVVTVVTSTNHLPFRLPGDKGKTSKDLPPRRRLHRTMAFTDRALEKFFDRLRQADWYEDTVFVLTGDHGYDLGERGFSGRMTNLRHENTWVPLIIHGAHPLLPRGRMDTVGSHVDIGPTILGLAGVCRPNAFFGHDLTNLEVAPAGFALTIREGAMALEIEDHSFYFPLDGAPMVFTADDPMQRRDVSGRLPAQVVARFEKLARRLSRVFDELYESASVRPGRGRFPPETGPTIKSE